MVHVVDTDKRKQYLAPISESFNCVVVETINQDETKILVHQQDWALD